MKSLLFGLVAVGLGLRLAAAELPLSIDKDHSKIAYDVQVTIHPFSGTLTAYQADILVDQALGKVTKAQLRFKFADLHSGEDKRDHDMLAWENNDQFPEVVFTLTSLDAGPAGGKFTAKGQLLLHGQTKEISFPVSIVTKDNLGYSIDGDTTVDTRDYGLPVIRKFGFLKVDPQVRVSFHLQGSVSAK
jgi:polyisoprenoid-binding protein YceI